MPAPDDGPEEKNLADDALPRTREADDEPTPVAPQKARATTRRPDDSWWTYQKWRFIERRTGIKRELFEKESWTEQVYVPKPASMKPLVVIGLLAGLATWHYTKGETVFRGIVPDPRDPSREISVTYQEGIPTYWPAGFPTANRMTIESLTERVVLDDLRGELNLARRRESPSALERVVITDTETGSESFKVRFFGGASRNTYTREVLRTKSRLYDEIRDLIGHAERSLDSDVVGNERSEYAALFVNDLIDALSKAEEPVPTGVLAPPRVLRDLAKGCENLPEDAIMYVPSTGAVEKARGKADFESVELDETRSAAIATQYPEVTYLHRHPCDGKTYLSPSTGDATTWGDVGDHAATVCSHLLQHPGGYVREGVVTRIQDGTLALEYTLRDQRALAKALASLPRDEPALLDAVCEAFGFRIESDIRDADFWSELAYDDVKGLAEAFNEASPYINVTYTTLPDEK